MKNEEKIKELREKIIHLKNYMFEQEVGNDFYYSKGTYQSDSFELRRLEKELDELLGEE